MDFLLLVIAWALKIILSPILLIYGLFMAIFKCELGKYLKSLAIILDVFGNVLGKYLFDDILKERIGYAFGNRLDTISYALGKNKENDTLSKFGRFMGKILNLLDKNHLEKAIGRK